MAAIDDILTLNEAAEQLGLSAHTLRNAAASGVFRARKFGGMYVTTQEEVERYRRDHLGRTGRREPGTVIFFRNEVVHLVFDDSHARAASHAIDTLVRGIARSVEDEGGDIPDFARHVARVVPVLGVIVRLQEVGPTAITYSFKKA